MTKHESESRLLGSKVTIAEAIAIMSDSNMGAATAMLALVNIGYVTGPFALDDLGLYGADIWRGFKDWAACDAKKFRDAIRRADDEMIKTARGEFDGPAGYTRKQWAEQRRAHHARRQEREREGKATGRTTRMVKRIVAHAYEEPNLTIFVVAADMADVLRVRRLVQEELPFDHRRRIWGNRIELTNGTQVVFDDMGSFCSLCGVLADEVYIDHRCTAVCDWEQMDRLHAVRCASLRPCVYERKGPNDDKPDA